MSAIRAWLAIVLIFQISCTGNAAKTSGEDSVAKQKTVVEKTEQPTQTDVVASDENGVIVETRKDAILLFGKNTNVLPSELRQSIAGILVSMNSQMTNASAVAVGPMTLVYEKLPALGKQNIFVGQPVKKKFVARDGFDFMEIPASGYYKMICNAEIGNTIPFHEKMQQLLKKSSRTFSAPVLEVFSESRNQEMTVVSKATLLYSFH